MWWPSYERQTAVKKRKRTKILKLSYDSMGCSPVIKKAIKNMFFFISYDFIKKKIKERQTKTYARRTRKGIVIKRQ